MDISTCNQKLLIRYFTLVFFPSFSFFYSLVKKSCANVGFDHLPHLRKLLMLGGIWVKGIQELCTSFAIFLQVLNSFKIKNNSEMKIKMQIDYKLPLQRFQKMQESMNLLNVLKHC